MVILGQTRLYRLCSLILWFGQHESGSCPSEGSLAGDDPITHCTARRTAGLRVDDARPKTLFRHGSSRARISQCGGHEAPRSAERDARRIPTCRAAGLPSSPSRAEPGALALAARRARRTFANRSVPRRLGRRHAAMHPGTRGAFRGAQHGERPRTWRCLCRRGPSHRKRTCSAGRTVTSRLPRTSTMKPGTVRSPP